MRFASVFVQIFVLGVCEVGVGFYLEFIKGVN